MYGIFPCDFLCFLNLERLLLFVLIWGYKWIDAQPDHYTIEYDSPLLTLILLVTKLELSGALTLHAASASIWELERSTLSCAYAWVCWWPLPRYARPVVCMSRKHMAYSRLVGMVNRQGEQMHYLWRSWARNRSILKPVFRRLWRIRFAYESLRCLNLEIWRFLWWRQLTKPIALPLMHVHEVINHNSGTYIILYYV